MYGIQQDTASAPTAKTAPRFSIHGMSRCACTFDRLSHREETALYSLLLQQEGTTTTITLTTATIRTALGLFLFSRYFFFVAAGEEEKNKGTRSV